LNHIHILPKKKTRNHLKRKLLHLDLLLLHQAIIFTLEKQGKILTRHPLNLQILEEITIPHQIHQKR